MRDNSTTRWSVGCKLVQWQYNTQIHRTVGNKSPYQLCFGQLPRCGISNLPLSSELLDTLHTEDELNALLHTNQLEHGALTAGTVEQEASPEVVGNENEDSSKCLLF